MRIGSSGGACLRNDTREILKSKSARRLIDDLREGVSQEAEPGTIVKDDEGEIINRFLAN